MHQNASIAELCALARAVYAISAGQPRHLRIIIITTISIHMIMMMIMVTITITYRNPILILCTAALHHSLHKDWHQINC
jgi:Na+-driven multidrug efflux pump